MGPLHTSMNGDEPPVIKNGLLENIHYLDLVSPICFPAIKLHLVRAGISQRRLITGR